MRQLLIVSLLLVGCATAPVDESLFLQSAEPTLAQKRCADPSRRYVLSSAAAERSVLVLPGDANQDSVRRDLSMVARVGRALMDELSAPGMRVFDEGGLTTTLSKGRRWADKELVDAAVKDVREPVDRLVLYSVFVDNYPEGNRFHARVRVAARLYALPDGNLLGGGYEATDTVVLPIPAICDTSCFTGLLGDAARPLGQMVGRKLVPGVRVMSKSYPVELFGFDSGEVQRIEDELRARPGYSSHRVEEDSGDFVRLRYASMLQSSDLSHNLRTLTQCLNLPSRVEFSREGYAVRRRDR